MIKEIQRDNSKILIVLAPVSMEGLKLVTELCERYHNEVIREFNINIELKIVKSPEEELATSTHLNNGTILTLEKKSQHIEVEKYIKKFIVGTLMTAINKYERK